MVLCGSGRVKQRNGIAEGAIMGKNELEVAAGSSLHNKIAAFEDYSVKLDLYNKLGDTLR